MSRTSIHSSSSTLSIRSNPLNLFIISTVSNKRFDLDLTWMAQWFSLLAAAAAKSLQLCPTLCDPIDGSPAGSIAPGILQARTLEWVAISFPYLLQFKSEFYNKELMNWATVSSRSCFYWLFHLWLQKHYLISVLTIWWCPCVESSVVLLEKGVCYDQCVLLTKLC